MTEPEQRPRPALEHGLTFLASYPKSGNTWVRLLFRAYFHGRPDQFAQFDDIADLPFQAASPLPVSELTPLQEAQLRPAALLYIARMAGPYRALVKTHHASQEAQGLPLFCEAWTDQVIHLVRDPRDVVPSLMGHMDHGSLAESVEMLNSSGSQLSDPERITHHLGSWSDHTGSWLRQDRVEAKTFKFEDLKADTAGTFREMLEFVGEEEVDEERLEVACDRTRLENLQAIEDEVGFREASPHQERFFGSGTVGKELPADLEDEILEAHGDVMRQVGYATTPRHEDAA